LAAGACDPDGPGSLLAGVWGGDNAGMIVDEASVHVHIGCTQGNSFGPLQTDPNGRFEGAGRYNLRAFPVLHEGDYEPALFEGTVRGPTASLTVRLTNSGQTLGPVRLRFGVPPAMQDCPICERH
jgi:hypothetical protein